MFNLIKKTIFTTIFLIVVILPLSIYAEENYYISNYDIKINVNENNLLEITEIIDVYFLEESFGIFRELPLSNNVFRLDGTMDIIKSNISNLHVSEYYYSYATSDVLYLIVGDGVNGIVGDKQYIIEYDYQLSRDSTVSYDELYFNLIGTNWNSYIKNVNFQITMPKDFDESLVGFASGQYGSTSNYNVDYSVVDNTIYGTIYEELSPYEGLTIRVKLPNDYFIYESSHLLTISFLLPITLFLITLYLWFKYAKSDLPSETVEFYPPSNLNSLDVALIYKMKAKTNDVTSLLIYLASKGYISIKEIETQSIVDNFIDYRITKLKDYDGSNKMEEEFIDGLFNFRSYSKDDSIKPSSIRTSFSKLRNGFYKIITSILHDINDKENIYKIVDKKSFKLKKYLIIFLFIIMFITNLCLLNTFPILKLNLSLAFIPIVIFTYLLYSLQCFKSKGFSYFYIIAFTFIYSRYSLSIYHVLEVDIIYKAMFLLSFATLIGILLIYLNFDKRTEYGTEMYFKIKSFKKFLNLVEKEKLEKLVDEDPEYFYNILPYAYVLGVSDKWIEKFENISSPNPGWYYGKREFDLNRFSTSFRRSYLNKGVHTSSSSGTTGGTGSGGSFSGGGFSGGGSGGGGGGSW
ncbi:MAG: DUF2207 domain-containing protein [bacterium]